MKPAFLTVSLLSGYLLKYNNYSCDSPKWVLTAPLILKFYAKTAGLLLIFLCYFKEDYQKTKKLIERKT